MAQVLLALRLGELLALALTGVSHRTSVRSRTTFSCFTPTSLYQVYLPCFESDLRVYHRPQPHLLFKYTLSLLKTHSFGPSAEATSPPKTGSLAQVGGGEALHTNQPRAQALGDPAVPGGGADQVGDDVA